MTTPLNTTFNWSDIDPEWERWDAQAFRSALGHPLAEQGFRSDWRAMQWADTCVLLLPCWRSGHLEAGYFVGAGKRLFVLLSDGQPDLTYKMATGVCTSLDEVLRCLEAYASPLCIYVASSWRNLHQAEVVTALRIAGHDVYDFRNPEEVAS